MNNATNTLPALTAAQTAWLKANDIELNVSRERGYKFFFLKDLGHVGPYNEQAHASVTFDRLDGPAKFELMINDREDGWQHAQWADYATVKEALKAIVDAAK